MQQNLVEIVPERKLPIERDSFEDVMRRRFFLFLFFFSFFVLT